MLTKIFDLVKTQHRKREIKLIHRYRYDFCNSLEDEEKMACNYKALYKI